MPKIKDFEVRLPGITPRAHALRKNQFTGRRKFPFKAMIIGDFIIIENQEDAVAVRNGLKTFYRAMLKQRKIRVFTVRPNDLGQWICRRTG